jgi:hypothetical protein
MHNLGQRVDRAVLEGAGEVRLDLHYDRWEKWPADQRVTC